MDNCANLKFSKDHLWLRIEGSEGVVGVTDFAQNQLGDVIYVETSPVGTKIAQNDSFGTVEAVKTVSDVFMPVSGEIIAFNTELDHSPELINKDPYGTGWIIRIRMADPREVEVLMSESDYKKLI